MKLSQAIQQLQSLLIEHGDLELKSEAIDENGEICYAEPIFVQQVLTVISSNSSDQVSSERINYFIDSEVD